MSTHPNILNTNESLLVVIDIQSRLVAAMPEQNVRHMLKNSSYLLETAETLEIPVLLTEQYPKGLGPTAPLISKKLPKNTPVLDKTGFSCCASNEFSKALTQSGRKQIILVGQEAHVCVLQTALELLHQDYQVYIVEDATCSRKKDHHSYALQRMQQQGATITCCESVLFEWLKNSNHPDFKTISKLLH